MTTPQAASFDESYRTGEPPWVIGEPQPAVVDLARAGALASPVLDLGCGAGEHTALLAGLGHHVVGADASPAALERARAQAQAAGVTPELVLVDVLDPAALGELGRFATVLDSALFHVFDPDDQARYARALTRVVVPGGTVFVLALSTRGPGFGPRIDDDAVTTAFAAPDWAVETLQQTVYRGRVISEEQAAVTGRAAGALVDLPAVLARVRRAGS
jgi:SAM-dependent methyltransferase